LTEAGCDLTICNYAIWCYPHLTAVATAFAPGPFLLFCNVHPSEPGMVGMLAAAGTLAQVDRPLTRVWGRIEEKAVLAKGKTVTPEWPIAFTRLECTADRFLSRFPCNHIHGCYGDWTAELLHVGDLLGIETLLFDGQQPS